MITSTGSAKLTTSPLSTGKSQSGPATFSLHERGFVQYLLILILLIGIGAAVYLTQFTQVFKPKAAQESNHKIIVRGNKLIDSATNQEFLVRSNQFIKIVPNPLKLNGTIPDAPDIINTFSPNVFTQEIDVPYNEGHFAKMQSLGYNTIRLVFNTSADGDYGANGLCRDSNPTNYQFINCVNAQSMENLATTINQAKKYNLKVILSFVAGLSPRYNRYYNTPVPRPPTKEFLLDPEAVSDYGRYLKDFLTYLKPKIDPSTILSIQPLAEPALDGNSYPLRGGDTISPGEFNVTGTFQVTPALINKTGSGHISPQMRQLIKESFTLSFNSWFDSIKSVDPTFLTAYDQFPSYAIRAEDGHLIDGQPIPFRINDDMELLNPDLKADIIGMQIYRFVPRTGPAYPEFDYDNLVPGQVIYLMLTFNDNFQPALMTHAKPFIVWEYAYNAITDPPSITQDPVKFTKEWMVATCPYNPQGWNYFFWRSANSLSAKTVDDNAFLIADGVSPVKFPDPCPRTPPSPSPSPARKVGDIDNNGRVDIFDFNFLVQDYKGTNMRSDLNGDNKVDLFDFNLLITNFGK